jgi:hypothetical protein
VALLLLERIFLFKATPHKDRLMALLHICLNIFRHFAQKSLDIRKYACEISIQSDEKSYCASAQQSLCGVALNLSPTNQ